MVRLGDLSRTYDLSEVRRVYSQTNGLQNVPSLQNGLQNAAHVRWDVDYGISVYRPEAVALVSAKMWEASGGRLDDPRMAYDPVCHVMRPRPGYEPPRFSLRPEPTSSPRWASAPTEPTTDEPGCR